MFCSNCGAEAEGNFCWKCGARLNAGPGQPGQASATPQPGAPPVPPPLPETPRDWSHEVVYEKLIRVPEVRELIDKNAAMARKRMSGEEFLALADKIIPLGFSLEKLTAVAQPIYVHLGAKTGKERGETLAAPAGKVIVAALCSLARNGQALKQVHQSEDGCLLEATLPSDLWSFEGDLLVSIRTSGPGTRIDGTTKICGQMYDWGKSKRCLEGLFADVKAMTK